MLQKLPIEIKDKIFLFLDFETLEKTRCYQSEYVKKITKFSKINEATEHGNLDNIKWLMSKGITFDEDTMQTAAENGNLDNMKWLRSKDCPWNKSPYSYTFQNAARNGNLDNIKWLHENDCPWAN